MWKRAVPLVSVLVLAGVALGACSSAGGEEAAGAEPAASVEGRTIIDVRTPEEFAEGHLAGAANIDFQSPSFADEIAELPRDGSYFLYCRSGNRSAQAEQVMRDLGFDDIVDGGGFEALRASGVPTA
jgi:phage shock protein E